MPGTVRIFDTATEAAEQAASRVARAVVQAQQEDRPLVLGLPTGDTPKAVYRELVRRHREEGLRFDGVTTFNLDEYWPMKAAHPLSFTRYMRERFVDPVGLPSDRFHIPDGACPEDEVDDHCLQYRRAIAEAGGIGLMLLGLGANGHIGFNEPGSKADSVARLVQLAPETVERIRELHPEQEPPRFGITLGVVGILAARRILVLATGKRKAEVVRRALQDDESAEVPASYLRRHASVEWFLDDEAAVALDRSRLGAD